MKRSIMTCALALLGSGAIAQQAPNAPMARQPIAMPMAAEGQPVCPRDAVPIPAELAAWASRKPMAAAVDAASLPGVTVTPGMAVDLGLAPTPGVTYTLRPSHPGGSVSHGGMATLTVAEAGKYEIGIGSGAWIDLVKDGVSLGSVGHGHGPACSGIRKMVDFALQPGSYVLQVAGNGEATLPLIFARLP